MSAANSKIDVRKIEESDLDSLVNDLNPWGYKQKRGRVFFEWWRQCRPYEGISVVATLNNKIIAYYGNITIPLKVGNQIIPCFRGGIYVHPAHRKKKYNLFNLLQRMMHDEVRQVDGVFYGFPVPKLVNYYVQRLGGIKLKIIPRYIYLLDITHLFEHILKHKRIAHWLGIITQPLWQLWLQETESRDPEITIHEVSSFDKRFDALWEKASFKLIHLREGTATALS